MAYQRREYPQWSWSFSRLQTFEACKRVYYYHYYASHNGWERNAPSLAAAAYRLKKLTNLYTALGGTVHQTAQLAVERLALGKPLMAVGEIEERIREKMRSVWQWSVSGRQQFIQRRTRCPCCTSSTTVKAQPKTWWIGLTTALENALTGWLPPSLSRN